MTEAQFGRILSVFAGLAIFIACLGLLGLTAAVTAQRRKEIGVRKVLGASAPGIVYLLSKDFAMLVLIASLVATPVVFIGMNSWLDGFAFRTNLSIWTFLEAGGAALLVAILAMNYQTIRAAIANPVDSIKSE
jgi:putative ABC transport system permease protein